MLNFMLTWLLFYQNIFYLSDKSWTKSIYHQISKSIGKDSKNCKSLSFALLMALKVMIHTV